MVFAAHPDDESIGCGGSMAKYASQGRRLFLTCMTSSNSQDAREIRETEAHNAAKKLGVEELFFLREPDRFLEYNRNALIPTINLLRRTRPDYIFIPHPDEHDRDHRSAYDISSEAAWLSSSPYMPELGKPCDIKGIFMYEVWTPIQHPQYFEDITGFVQQKRSAIECYGSQISHVNYADAAIGLNKFRGIMSGTGDFSEAFLIKRLRDVCMK
ncbi:MAG: PIG-L family deacetylase [Candidatus Aenigmarchaeota archaeon]|nr:PIG-L family deacetylase [Candidatus Aenigmarchaeota archaeon]